MLEMVQNEHHSFSLLSTLLFRQSVTSSPKMHPCLIEMMPIETFFMSPSCRIFPLTPSATLYSNVTTFASSSINVTPTDTTPFTMHLAMDSSTFSPLSSNTAQKSTRKQINDNHHCILLLSKSHYPQHTLTTLFSLVTGTEGTTHADNCSTLPVSSAFSMNLINMVKLHCISAVRMVTHESFNFCSTKVHSSPRALMVTHHCTKQPPTVMFRPCTPFSKHIHT